MTAKPYIPNFENPDMRQVVDATETNLCMLLPQGSNVWSQGRMKHEMRYQHRVGEDFGYVIINGTEEGEGGKIILESSIKNLVDEISELDTPEAYILVDKYMAEIKQFADKFGLELHFGTPLQPDIAMVVEREITLKRPEFSGNPFVDGLSAARTISKGINFAYQLKEKYREKYVPPAKEWDEARKEASRGLCCL